jgi:hypothetical protein
MKSRGSAVGKATGYKIDYRAVALPVPVGQRISTPPFRTRRLRAPSILLCKRYGGGALSPEIKRPAHESDPSFPSTAQIKKTWIIHPLPTTSSWCSARSVTRRDKFTSALPHFPARMSGDREICLQWTAFACQGSSRSKTCSRTYITFW